jgi:hypothetical protein
MTTYADKGVIIPYLKNKNNTHRILERLNVMCKTTNTMRVLHLRNELNGLKMPKGDSMTNHLTT